MQCPRCRASIEADSKFCRQCGATVSSSAAATDVGRVGDVGRVSRPDISVPAPNAPAAPAEPNPYRDPAYEQDVWHGRPAWRASYGLWFLWAVASIAVLYAAGRSEAGELTRKAVWLLIAAIAAVVLVRQALTTLGQQYRLTTQRLFIYRGILAKVTDQLELVRVDDVRLRQGIIDRMVNTGDIEIISGDKTDENVWLESIGNPADVAEALRRNVRAARSKGTLFVENV